MTNRDKTNILYFIIRTGMYVPIVDETTVVSFIHGYQAGTHNRCDFTEQIKDYLTEDLGIKYSSDGWPGQIQRYSIKFQVPWVVAFKQLGLQILASEKTSGLDEPLQEAIKKHIKTLVARIDETNPWFNQHWIEECSVFLAINSTWFINLWSNEQNEILKSILDVVQNNQAFEPGGSFFPSKHLLELKCKFAAIQSISI